MQIIVGFAVAFGLVGVAAGLLLRWLGTLEHADARMFWVGWRTIVCGLVWCALWLGLAAHLRLWG